MQRLTKDKSKCGSISLLAMRTLFDCGRSAWVIYSLKHDCFIDVQNGSAGWAGLRER
jgi:hypothetical protein